MFIEVNMFLFVSWILYDSKQTLVIKSCNFFPRLPFIFYKDREMLLISVCDPLT